MTTAIILYRCSACGETYETDAEGVENARVEFDNNYPGHVYHPNNISMVCDECFDFMTGYRKVN